LVKLCWLLVGALCSFLVGGSARGGEARVYLLIGTSLDACIAQVSRKLQTKGEAVLVTSEPLAGAGQVCWELSTAQSSSHLDIDQRRIADTDWRGVVLRSSLPGQPEGWDSKDYSYMQAESQSALLAWLRSLPCPVVNPARAETFYRERTLPEQRVWLSKAGLPTWPVLLTNSPAQARRFARRWAGSLSYVPLTSSTRYPIDSESQWAELERLMERFPVCLMQPDGPSIYLSLAGDTLVWSEEPDLGRAKGRLEAAVRRLAELLGVQMVEVEIQLTDGQARVFGFSLRPEFGLYGEAQQEALAEGVVAVLEGVRA